MTDVPISTSSCGPSIPANSPVYRLLCWCGRHLDTEHAMREFGYSIKCPQCKCSVLVENKKVVTFHMTTYEIDIFMAEPP